MRAGSRMKYSPGEDTGLKGAGFPEKSCRPRALLYEFKPRLGPGRAAFPAGSELRSRGFAAGRAYPGISGHRRRGLPHFFDLQGLGQLLIFLNPQLRRAFRERNFRRQAGRDFIAHEARDARRLQHIPEYGDFAGVGRAKDFFHGGQGQTGSLCFYFSPAVKAVKPNDAGPAASVPTPGEGARPRSI